MQPVHTWQPLRRDDQQRHCQREQGDADDIVEVAVVNIRRSRAPLRQNDPEQQRDEWHQPEVREGRLLVHLLDQRLQ